MGREWWKTTCPAPDFTNGLFKTQCEDINHTADVISNKEIILYFCQFGYWLRNWMCYVYLNDYGIILLSSFCIYLTIDRCG